MLLGAVGSFRRAREPDVDNLDARILEALASSPAGPDALARRVGMSAGDLASHLARLVVRGVVTAAPDGRFGRR